MYGILTAGHIAKVVPPWIGLFVTEAPELDALHNGDHTSIQLRVGACRHGCLHVRHTFRALNEAGR